MSKTLQFRKGQPGVFPVDHNYNPKGKTTWLFCFKCQRVVTISRYGTIEVIISDCKCARNPNFKAKRYKKIGVTKSGR